jgi:GNAT superfamily N-acetyltransferase
MKIKEYEPWMKEQVINLFTQQYPEQIKSFPTFFEKLYENNEFKNDSLRVVAIESNQVIGFQSFFYWPYQKGNKVFNSYQSGNSLVHPNHRGKGIFQRLLNYIYELAAQKNIDFLIGFPVEMSLPSFKKNGWIHLMDLQWNLKIIHPIPCPTKYIFKNQKAFKSVIPDYSELKILEDEFTLSKDQDWRSWKTSLSSQKKYFFRGSVGNMFELKINRRWNYFNEVIIGDLGYIDQDSLKKDLKELIQKLRMEFNVNFISIAANPSTNNSRLDILRKAGFKRVDKYIHFIVKPITIDHNKLLNKEDWNLFRGDLDTW